VEIQPLPKLIAQLGERAPRAHRTISGLDLPTTLALTWEEAMRLSRLGPNAVTIAFEGRVDPVRTERGGRARITRRYDHCLRHPPKEFSYSSLA